MPSANEQKEDIRLRVADLEKKLAKRWFFSEEKRRELEKACDVLIRVFREEEKMHYNALNKKYEKFLQDYSVRQRRNDIILTSLHRIEDRSRALFTKTERLKLLKDQYVSYLKINEFKYLSKNFPVDSVKAADDVTAKAVRWKTPVALSFRSEKESEEARRDHFSGRGQRNRFPYESMSGSVDVEQYGREKSNEFQKGERRTNSVERTTDVDFHGSQTNVISVEIKSEELARDRSRIMQETTFSKDEDKLEDEHPKETITAGIEVVDRHESTEELRKTVSHDPEYRILSENGDFRTNEIDPVTVRNDSFDKPTRINHNVVTSSPKTSAYEEFDTRRKDMELESVETVQQEKDSASETSPKPEKALPLGLDGVDYQNETYPESYYEQPVHHHNHTSIASDVILEEDETEQDVDDEESYEEPAEPDTAGGNGSHWVKTWGLVKGHTGVDEPGTNREANKGNELSDKGYLNSRDVDEAFENVKSQQSDSENSSEAKQGVVHLGEPKSSPSERAATDKSEMSKTATKSNLIHMLESDSESFQIENGDGVTRNDDSDFDFSFGKN